MEPEAPDNQDRDGKSLETDNVVRMVPRDWLSPTDELVPFGPSAERLAGPAGRGPHDSGGAATSDPDPESAGDAFWTADSASLHTALDSEIDVGSIKRASGPRSRSRGLKPLLWLRSWSAAFTRNRFIDLHQIAPRRALACVAGAAVVLIVAVLLLGSSGGGSTSSRGRRLPLIASSFFHSFAADTTVLIRQADSAATREHAVARARARAHRLAALRAERARVRRLAARRRAATGSSVSTRRRSSPAQSSNTGSVQTSASSSAPEAALPGPSSTPSPSPSSSSTSPVSGSGAGAAHGAGGGSGGSCFPGQPGCLGTSSSTS